MITNLLISLVVTSVSLFTSWLPSLAVPSWFSTSGVTTTIATDIGDLLGVMRPIFPVDALLTPLAAIVSLWPVIIAYVAFNWAWNHVPEIFGFGTH